MFMLQLHTLVIVCCALRLNNMYKYLTMDVMLCYLCVNGGFERPDKHGHKTQLKVIHNDVVEWRARAWKGEVT